MGSLALAVQDLYEYDEGDKWAAFCAEADDPDGVVLRFLSPKGHMTFGHPYRYAKEPSPRLLALCENQDIFLGWTVVDFGNARLASAIYGQNLMPFGIDFAARSLCSQAAADSLALAD